MSPVPKAAKAPAKQVFDGRAYLRTHGYLPLLSRDESIHCLILTSFADDEALFDSIMAGAAVTILTGLVRRRAAFLARLPGAMYVLLGAALFWPLPLRPQPWVRAASLATACALVGHLALEYRKPAEACDDRSGSARASVVYLAAALLCRAYLR